MPSDRSIRTGFYCLMTGLIGYSIGVTVGVNRTMEMAAAALGWPTEELHQQIRWHYQPVEKKT